MVLIIVFAFVEKLNTFKQSSGPTFSHLHLSNFSSQALSVAEAWPLMVMQSSSQSRSNLQMQWTHSLSTFQEINKRETKMDYSIGSKITKEFTRGMRKGVSPVLATRCLVSHLRVTAQSND